MDLTIPGGNIMNQRIFVTQPSLPPLDDFVESLEKIWENKVLTNGGEFHQELERSLCEYLGVKYVSLFTNGTVALLTALQALNIKGEVITTPYSFVATANSLLWNGLKPVFVDVENNTLNIDPLKIEAAITEKTSAIMPVHCYGRPCDVETIGRIAKNNKLKVIYDAAHAFAVEVNGESVLNYGDLSVLSFHATKVFNTFEGGAIISHTSEMKRHIDNLKNFGFVDEITVIEAGINGKMSEINAAVGLHQLRFIDKEIEKRASVAEYYKEKLSACDGIQIPIFNPDVKFNYSYYPIFVKKSFPCTRDELYEKMKLQNVFARRYFYPLITDFPMYKKLPNVKSVNFSTAKTAASEVLCLPIYSALSRDNLDRIIDVILACQDGV
jgi:dTDP-4-amino-4,6-dideoxygalactose transaminase